MARSVQLVASRKVEKRMIFLAVWLMMVEKMPRESMHGRLYQVCPSVPQSDD